MANTIDRFKRFDLTGRTAVITGGAGLLGREHASALVESGAEVVLIDIDESGLEEARTDILGHNDGLVTASVTDVSSPDEVSELAAKLAGDRRRVDILVNNAAVNPQVQTESGLADGHRLESFHLDEWNRQIAVGLTGAMLCSQAFGTAMARDGIGGVILNIASDLSVLAPDHRLYRRDGIPANQQPVKPVTYSVIKPGLVGLTRYLATYWMDRGVRANALSPGGVFTGQDEEFVRRVTSLIPMGRMAAPDEYRCAVQFLCSDASSYLNGQNIVIDGGRSVW